MAYCVIRTDKLSGTDQRADLVSLRVYKEDKPVEVENGVIVELKGLEKGQREIYKAEVATSASDIDKCAIVAGVELEADPTKKNLHDFINKAGIPCRGYIPRSRNVFSVTKEGFKDGTVPEVDGKVGIGDGGKLDKAATGFGKCVAIEVAGMYTYYVIEIDKTEK